MHKNINANYKQKKLPKELITLLDFSTQLKSWDSQATYPRT